MSPASLPPLAVGAGCRSTPGASKDAYHLYVNPQWVKLLDLLQMNVRYTRCVGAHLETDDGRQIVDFLSGYCVHNVGHNHPHVVEALKDELDRNGPAMLQSHVPELAGELAAKLCERAGGRLTKAFFCSSGSEGVEAAIKFARAHTGRTGLLYADGAFHGLTCGALSMMGDPFWRKDFGPMLSGTEAIPFNDLAALEKKLSTRGFAALFLEPIQGEGGVRVPDPGYLKGAQALCRKYDTLVVLDEVQTGLCRTGQFLASHNYGVEPDMVVLAKALSGGLIPSGAVLMSDAIYGSVYDSLKRAIVHTSTYSENALAMRAGLATLDVLDDEQLASRADRLGELLRRRLREELAGFEMVQGVRGVGLLCGVAFKAPKRLKLRVPFGAFRAIHPGMFGQMMVRRMFNEKGFLTQICGNDFMVLKVSPPLVVDEADIEKFVVALREVVEFVHTSNAFWSDALGLARRALDI
jgi:ornithine--oxo-acid transaminase